MTLYLIEWNDKILAGPFAVRWVVAFPARNGRFEDEPWGRQGIGYLIFCHSLTSILDIYE